MEEAGSKGKGPAEERLGVAGQGWVARLPGRLGQAGGLLGRYPHPGKGGRQAGVSPVTGLGAHQGELDSKASSVLVRASKPQQAVS